MVYVNSVSSAKTQVTAMLSNFYSSVLATGILSVRPSGTRLIVSCDGRTDRQTESL